MKKIVRKILSVPYNIGLKHMINLITFFSPRFATDGSEMMNYSNLITNTKPVRFLILIGTTRRPDRSERDNFK